MRWTVGDRFGAFGVLLPAHPVGPVVLAVEGRTAGVLQACFPGSTLLESRDRTMMESLAPCGPVVRWDGVTSPLGDKSAGLLVVDSQLASVETLRPALAVNGTVAILGASGEYVLYPSAEHPEQIWRQDWPLPVVPGVVPQLRRALGLWTSRPRHVPRLLIQDHSEPSTADLVMADLCEQTGEPGRLVGVQTGGFTVLRVRQRGRDVAVRLSFSNADRVVDVVSRVVDEVPAISAFIPPRLASGRAGGRPWVATAWHPRRRGLMLNHWRGQTRRWAAAAELASALQTVRTGVTANGWAHDWCEAVALLPADLRDRLIASLEVLEGGLPTGWSHGDLWPGNVLLGDGIAKVIDWDNATSSGPQGLDWLVMAAVKATRKRPTSVGAECVGLVDNPGDVAQAVVGGRRWVEWDRRHRVALALTAFLLYLRNRSSLDIGPERLAAELSPVRGLLDAEGD